MYDMGAMAASLLFRLFQKDQSVRSVMLETELIIRESCGGNQTTSRG
jgi:LacI family transcriptional regulator